MVSAAFKYVPPTSSDDLCLLLFCISTSSMTSFSGLPAAEGGYNKTCYCPGNPALDSNLLNLTAALRRVQARTPYLASGRRRNRFTVLLYCSAKPIPPLPTFNDDSHLKRFCV